MQIHIHAKFVLRRMKKERLRSTMTQSVFAVRNPKENIHEQACIHTRHRRSLRLEHCGVRSNLYHYINFTACSAHAVADACHEARKEAASRSALCLPQRQEARGQAHACY